MPLSFQGRKRLSRFDCLLIRWKLLRIEKEVEQILRNEYYYLRLFFRYITLPQFSPVLLHLSALNSLHLHSININKPTNLFFLSPSLFSSSLLFSFLVWGECTHVFHMHCLLKWLNTDSSKNQCPMDRRIWGTFPSSFLSLLSSPPCFLPSSPFDERSLIFLVLVWEMIVTADALKQPIVLGTPIPRPPLPEIEAESEDVILE